MIDFVDNKAMRRTVEAHSNFSWDHAWNMAGKELISTRDMEDNCKVFF